MQKALFLDRDGVINIDHGYVYEIEKFEFTEGIFELLRCFINKGYLLFIVTNQSGIGRGYYTEKNFQKLTSWMLDEFKKENINIVSVHHCNHAPEENCICRKPAIGMIDEILATNNIDLKNSWMIGDKDSDINLAYNSKISNSISIGENISVVSTLSFKTILECKEYMEVNKDRLI